MLIKFGDYNINYKYIYLVIIFNFLSYYVNDGNLSQLFLPNNKIEVIDNVTNNNNTINNETAPDDGNLSQLFFPDYKEDSNNDNKAISDYENLMQLLFSNQTEGNNNVNDSDYNYNPTPGDLYIHPIFIDNLNFLGVIIISFILYKIRGKASGINNQNDVNKSEVNVSEIKLIHNDIKSNLNHNISFLKLVFILSYWVFIDHIARILQSLMIFDYWMFELLFICLITSKLLKTEIYIHQKLGIIINSVSCLILGIKRFIIIYQYNKCEENISYFCVKYLWFIPISIIIYLFIVNSTSYIFTQLKFYMDLKFISHAKLLILYGIIGFVLTSIACSIETSFKCVGENKDFFCKIYVYYVNNNTIIGNDSYVENIHIFFKDFSGLKIKEKIIEIFLFLFGKIFYYCSLYFEIIVIKYLTPMHFMFSSLIYLLIFEFIYLIQNNTSEYDKDEVSYEDYQKYQKYQNSISVLNIIVYIISLIGFMIYLEIIEINFCKLNYNLRKYINDRSIKDSEIIMNDDSLSRSSSIIINDSVELDFKEERE